MNVSSRTIVALNVIAAVALAAILFIRFQIITM